LAAQRILIVEDNEDSALSLQMLLEALGHATTVVHDGEGAVKAACADYPDVILMDIGLPGMSGYEAARRIRADCRQKPILIIALTGWGQEDDRRQSAEAGMDHHLVKPLDLGKLRLLLEPAPPPGAA
jgi:two-component system CheB/CheR fusion protein